MRVCPKCGHSENLSWQQSRFAANHMFMRKEEFEKEFPKFWGEVTKHKPIQHGQFVYYLGKRAMYVKRYEIIGGSLASNYEASKVSKKGGWIKNINNWVKQQNYLRSKAQTKLFEVTT